MFDNIVIGIDGRDGGRAAAALARQLAAQEAEITLANVYGARSPVGRGTGIASVREPEAPEASEALLEREREAAGLDGAELLRSSERSVGRGLHEISAHVHADLLVIGATHRAGAARAILGDDTAAVLHRAPCPVAVAPLDDHVLRPPTAIGVGYDGSPESSLALAAGRALAGRWGARLQVMTVVPVNVRPFWERSAQSSPEVAERRQQLSGIDELDDVTVEVVAGEPGQQLSRWSEGLGLLAVGSRGQGALGRAVTGSIAAHLAMHSACPVLIWPRVTVRRRRASGEAEAPSLHG